MTNQEIQDLIVVNLTGRVHAVNPLVAIDGVDVLQDGLNVLDEMLQAGTVECHSTPVYVLPRGGVAGERQHVHMYALPI